MQPEQDVEILDKPPEHLRKKTKLCDACDLEEDITITQVTGDESRDFPHTRENCVKHPFGTRAFCDKCYCIICDKPAYSCTEWEYHHPVDHSFMDSKQSVLRWLKSTVNTTDVLKFEEEQRADIQKFCFDKDIMLQFVRLYGALLKYASVTLKADKEIVLAAITSQPDSILYADDSLWSNKEIAWKAVAQDPDALSCIHPVFFLDTDFLLNAVKLHKIRALLHIPAATKHNRDFFLEVMKVGGSMLRSGNIGLKSDKEVVATATQNYPRAFNYADESLRNDRDFVIQLLQKGQITLELLNEDLKSDEEVVMTALDHPGFIYGCAIRDASVTARANKNIILEAVKVDGNNIQFCTNHDLLMDPDILQAAANAKFRLTKKKLRSIMWTRIMMKAENELQAKMDTLNWSEQGTGKKRTVNISIKQSSASSGKRDGASLGSALASFAPISFPQGGNDYCVMYGLASALAYKGDESANYFAAIAPLSVSTDVTDRIKYAQNECLTILQPAWETLKLKNPSSLNPLEFDKNHIVLIQMQDSGEDCTHSVAITDGLIFDANQTHALPLTKEYLDHCCLGDSTFKSIVEGFELKPGTPSKKQKIE
jgi:hypothetical protein